MKLYHKRTMMPDTIICEGSLPWEALLSQRGCEVPVSSKQGHSGTVRFTVGNTQSPGNQAGLIPGTTTNTAGDCVLGRFGAACCQLVRVGIASQTAHTVGVAACMLLWALTCCLS